MKILFIKHCLIIRFVIFFLDFLPMLIYVVVHCGIIAAEIEADYMWDLINPAVMNTEGGYYLTSLNSAVLVLKNFKEMQEAQNTQHEVLLHI